MDLAKIREISIELISRINNISKGTEKEGQEIVSQLGLYVFSHEMDAKQYLFGDEYARFGNTPMRAYELVHHSVDTLFVFLSHEDFRNLHFGDMEINFKNEISNFFNEKLSQGILVKENYQEFISFLKKNLNLKLVLDLVNIRINHSKNLKEEFKAIIEYMTFSGKDHFEKKEFSRIEEAINLRLNILKKYNPEYFMKNFFLLEHNPLIVDQARYYYEEGFLMEIKNLILSLDRGENTSRYIQKEAKTLLHNQYSVIQENQERIVKLKEK